MATIKDVARESGYSISTVSYALKNDPKIPEKTRDKIKEAARMLNYVPNASARALKTGKTYSIGIFVPGFEGPVHSTLLSGIASVIRNVRDKYQMLVTLADANFPLVYQQQIDVAMIIGSHVPREIAINISNQIPLVLVDNMIAHPNIYNTFVDNAEGVRSRVEDFVQKGASRFIYMKGSKHSEHNTERFEGFKAGIEQCGLSLEDQVILDADSFLESRGYDCMKQYLQQHDLTADALICANDELALGAISALEQHGIAVPGRIRVSGFDNIEKGNYVTPSLSSISVDWHGYGCKLGRLVLDILEGDPAKDDLIRIPATLVERDSGR